jgi:Raf kinase inhibitor-like YbhB/YbcL family protein
MTMRKFAFVVLLAFVFSACGKTEKPPEKTEQAEKRATGMALSISSTAFKDSSTVPKKYTCDGQDVSPPLAWTGVPLKARSLALICDDPDAPMGTWVHWVLWGLPPSTPSLPEGLPKDATLPGNIMQGMNSGQQVGYQGPCPPPGKAHRYFFKLYALDAELNISGKVNKTILEEAMKGHILAQGQLMGTYGR